MITACSAGCDSCIMSGKGNCDGPRCNDGYYINSNFLCTSKYLNDVTWLRLARSAVVLINMVCAAAVSYVWFSALTPLRLSAIVTKQFCLLLAKRKNLCTSWIFRCWIFVDENERIVLQLILWVSQLVEGRNHLRWKKCLQICIIWRFIYCSLLVSKAFRYGTC